MRLRFKIGFVIAIALWAFLRGQGCAKPMTRVPVVLPPGDTTQVTIDPLHHNGSILTPTGRTTFTLPDRPSVIDVRRNGTVKVTSPQLGLETRPWIGAGYGQGARLYVGADLAYYKHADIGFGLGTPNLLDKSSQNFNDFRVCVFCSYNFYSNTRVSLGIDQQKTVHLLFSVRI